MFNVEDAVGHRYACALRVIAIGESPPGESSDERPVYFDMRGDRFAISAGEFRTLVERGLLVEEDHL